ncbi:Rib/alpha-like domain-containing protein, partial [Ligilactobacillus equi]|uniref:Rib/alpha-like domain-containing protein n=1 Tax=Ligilactobacillus equi TaxID=137357 RepID=UPI000A91C2BD
TPTAESVIGNASDLPADTIYAWTRTPDVTKAGQTSGVVEVTYPDSSTQAVTVPMTVTDKASDVEVTYPAVDVTKAGETTVRPDLIDANGQAVTSLPTGTTVTAEGNKLPAGMKLGDVDQKTGEVTVDV